jgi:DNA-binding transcriptional regulator YdaS (Cro superfamily)
VASSIVHEGMHARAHRMGVRPSRDMAHEERICRRAELAFGLALPPALGAPVVERALASLELDDRDVAPAVDWSEAMRRQAAIDEAARRGSR